MCRQVTCDVCGMVTWAGCGQHVEDALRGVPAERLCSGHHDDVVLIAPAR